MSLLQLQCVRVCFILNLNYKLMQSKSKKANPLVALWGRNEKETVTLQTHQRPFKPDSADSLQIYCFQLQSSAHSFSLGVQDSLHLLLSHCSLHPLIRLILFVLLFHILVLFAQYLLSSPLQNRFISGDSDYWFLCQPRQLCVMPRTWKQQKQTLSQDCLLQQGIVFLPLKVK